MKTTKIETSHTKVMNQNIRMWSGLKWLMVGPYGKMTTFGFTKGGKFTD
jgi:hypothetical protein